MRAGARQAVCVIGMLAALAAMPARGETAGELVAAIHSHRVSGRVSEAVTVALQLDQRVRSGEALGPADQEAFKDELEQLRDVLRPEVDALTARLVAAADRLAELSPQNDRFPRLEVMTQVEVRVKQARDGIEAVVAAARGAAATLDLRRARLESQAVVALTLPERKARLDVAVRSYGPAADAACHAGDLESAQRAAEAVTAAEKELATCTEAVRLWRLVADDIGREVDDALEAAEDAAAELEELPERIAAVRGWIAEGVEAADIPRRILPEARARYAEVEAAHGKLAGPADDLSSVRFALHQGDVSLGAYSVVHSAKRVVAGLESLVTRAEALREADRELERAAATADGYRARLAERERLAAEIEGVAALEDLCPSEWEAASAAVLRVRSCVAGQKLRAAGRAQSDAVPASPVASPPAGAVPPGPAPPRPPVAPPVPTPPSEGEVFGGLRIDPPGAPVRVPVGGAVRLRAVDMGDHPVAGARWLSTDEERAVVGADGTVRGLSEGPATVMAEAGGSRAYVDVLVVPEPGGEAAAPPAGEAGGISLLGETPDGRPTPAPGWDLDAQPAATPVPVPLPSPVPAAATPAPVAAGGGGWDLDGGAPAEQTPPPGGAAPAATAAADAGSAGWALDGPARAEPTPAAGQGGGWELDESPDSPAGLRLLGEDAAPAPAPRPDGAAGGTSLEGTWRLGTGGRTISFDCSGGGGVCVFGGWQPGDPATPLSPAGPGRWRGTAKAYGRSGSAGGPMQVTSVDDVELVVTVEGDRGTLRMTTPRINHGTPVDIAMTRVGGGTAPRDNSTAAEGPRAGPYHEFAALCRVGWAQGLARFSVGAADATIAGHLRAAGEHVMMANRTTFAPLRAWPDWQGIQGHYDGLAARLLREPGGRFREQLGVELEMAWEGLADALAVQMAGEVQRRENCDSHLARAGYLLCSGQQMLQIADAEERGGGRDRAAAMAQEGRRREAAARRELDAMRTVRLASGSCVDLSAVAPELDAAASARSTAASMAAADRAFAAALTILGGLAPPAPRHEILGEWCYSMFLDQKDLDHPETLCRIGFAQEGEWVVGRLVPGSCTPKKAESLLAGPPPVRDGQELLRVRKVGNGVYEGQGLTFGVLGGARVELQGERAQLFRWDKTSRDHRRLFRCTAP